MGGSTSGKGGVADANLNVVPFIDLLACLICFLLISAAWTQMSRLPVDQALPKRQQSPTPLPPPAEPKLNVAITPTGYLVNLVPAASTPTGVNSVTAPMRIPTVGVMKLTRASGTSAKGPLAEVEVFARYNKKALQEQLIRLMQTAGATSKFRVSVAATDDVPYLHLIAALDTVLHSCVGTNCLDNPTIGDVELMRSEGFTGFH